MGETKERQRAKRRARMRWWRNSIREREKANRRARMTGWKEELTFFCLLATGGWYSIFSTADGWCSLAWPFGLQRQTDRHTHHTNTQVILCHFNHMYSAGLCMNASVSSCLLNPDKTNTADWVLKTNDVSCLNNFYYNPPPPFRLLHFSTERLKHW